MFFHVDFWVTRAFGLFLSLLIFNHRIFWAAESCSEQPCWWSERPAEKRGLGAPWLSASEAWAQCTSILFHSELSKTCSRLHPAFIRHLQWTQPQSWRRDRHFGPTSLPHPLSTRPPRARWRGTMRPHPGRWGRHQQPQLYSTAPCANLPTPSWCQHHPSTAVFCPQKPQLRYFSRMTSRVFSSVYSECVSVVADICTWIIIMPRIVNIKIRSDGLDSWQL